MLNLGRKKRGRPATKAQNRTTVSFSAEDLAVLADLVASDLALLKRDPAARPVVSRLKAAMTRVQVPIPHGM